jgi:hypothetical protein
MLGIFYDLSGACGVGWPYTARKAWIIFSLAARTAGRKPPTNPMSKEKPSEAAAIDGDKEKEKASSETAP